MLPCAVMMGLNMSMLHCVMWLLQVCICEAVCWVDPLHDEHGVESSPELLHVWIVHARSRTKKERCEEFKRKGKSIGDSFSFENDEITVSEGKGFFFLFFGRRGWIPLIQAQKTEHKSYKQEPDERNNTSTPSQILFTDTPVLLLRSPPPKWIERTKADTSSADKVLRG